MTIEQTPHRTTIDGIRRDYLFAYEQVLKDRSESAGHAWALEFRARRWSRATIAAGAATVALLLASPGNTQTERVAVDVSAGVTLALGVASVKRRDMATAAHERAAKVEQTADAFVAAEVCAAAEDGQRPAPWARWEIAEQGLPALADWKRGEFPPAVDVHQALQPLLEQYAPPQDAV